MSLGGNKKTIGQSAAAFRSGGGGGVAPAIITNPVLSGIFIVGQTINCNTGFWLGSLPITYGFTFIGSNDGGATFTVLQSSAIQTYVLLPSDAGTLIRCNVTAINGFLPNGFAGSNDVNILATLIDIDGVGLEEGYHAFNLLRGGYYGSPLIRVRRSGDNSEQNFGVTTEGVLDTNSLLLFVGSNNGYIVNIFSQKIGGNNLGQVNPSLQPQIVALGEMIKRGGVNCLLFKPNDTMNKTLSNLSTNYSIFTNGEYPATVRHGDISTGVTTTWPIVWNVPNTNGWRRELPSLTYLQSGSLTLGLSKKSKVRNLFTLSLNISKVLKFTNTGNFSDITNLPFTGFIVPVFGATEGTTYQRGLIVYNTSKTFTEQNKIIDSTW